MSTLATTDNLPASPATPLVSTYFTRLAEVRSRSATRRIRQQIARMDNERLARIGLTPSQIAELRRTGRLPHLTCTSEGSDLRV